MQEFTLTKVSGFIKKEYPLLLLGTISIIIAGLYAFNLTKPKITYNGVMWMGKIAPGHTTFEELKKTIGQPLDAVTENSKIIYSYPTTNEKRPTKIEAEVGVVQQIQEPVIANEKGTLFEYISKFGEPEKVIYGEHGFAAPANFWGSKGIIVFGNPLSGLIVEIWYFPPTSLDDFLAKHPEFTIEPNREDL